MDEPSVFISHITEEAPVAHALKALIHAAVGTHVAVFCSSDYSSIPTGTPPFERIMQGLKTADVVVLLLSKHSLERRWINFEAGYAYALRKRIFPLGIRGTRGDVGSPLSLFLQVRELNVKETLLELIASLPTASITEAGEREVNDFLKRYPRVAASMPFRGAELVPFLVDLTGIRWLKIRIRNTGNSPVHLIAADVLVPKYMFRDTFYLHGVTYIREKLFERLDGVEYEGYRLRTYIGGDHPQLEPLPEVLPPGWDQPMEQLSIALKSTVPESHQRHVPIYYQLFFRDEKSERVKLSIGDIPIP